MARFTAAEKWGDGWFSNLKPLEKLIFLYLTDKCDNAGFYEINYRIDPFVIGITKEEYEEALKHIKKCYITSNDGQKIWLRNYLKHQKNLPLNPENNAHKQIILFIQSNQTNFEYDFNILAPNKGLFRDLGNVIGKVIGNCKVNGHENLQNPIGSEKTKEAARKAWDDQIWRESTCMGNSLKEADLKKWMAQYNASIMNDVIPNFNEGSYKKMFGGWLQTQKSKGRSISSANTEVDLLRKL